MASLIEMTQGNFSQYRLPSLCAPNVLPSTPLTLSDDTSNISASLFTISSSEAAKLVRNQKKRDDDKYCFLLQLSFQSVYSDTPIPNACLKKLPRLLNGIPLGPGLMARNQMDGIRWRHVEGGTRLHTFISVPMYEDEAKEAKTSLKDTLMKQSHAVFGDITVKASVILSHCIHYDDDIVFNDIAVSLEEGLHFRD